MTDINDIAADYRRHQEAMQRANAFTKTAVFEALTAENITSVVVTFDGEGDSGQIDDIIATAHGKQHALPGLTVETQRATWGTDTIECKRTTLADAIETLCYAVLSEAHDGWENNDGAFGNFTFNVAARSIELEFNGRFTDVFTTTQTF